MAHLKRKKIITYSSNSKCPELKCTVIDNKAANIKLKMRGKPSV